MCLPDSLYQMWGGEYFGGRDLLGVWDREVLSKWGMSWLYGQLLEVLDRGELF